jgi:hypothetical protein
VSIFRSARPTRNRGSGPEVMVRACHGTTISKMGTRRTGRHAVASCVVRYAMVDGSILSTCGTNPRGRTEAIACLGL